MTTGRGRERYGYTVTAPSGYFTVPRSSLVAETDDLDELLGVQRRATHQGAVDIRLGHDRGDVPGLDRAAVLDPHAVGERLVVQLGEPDSDRAADLLGVRRGGDLTCAD